MRGQRQQHRAVGGAQVAKYFGWVLHGVVGLEGRSRTQACHAVFTRPVALTVEAGVDANPPKLSLKSYMSRKDEV